MAHIHIQAHTHPHTYTQRDTSSSFIQCYIEWGIASISRQRSFTMTKSLWNSARKYTHTLIIQTPNWQAFVLPLCYRQYLQSCFVCAIVDAVCACVLLCRSFIFSHNEFFFSFSMHCFLHTLSLSQLKQPLLFMLWRFDIFMCQYTLI